MFDWGHLVGYVNYRDLIWVLYPTIDLQHLPPSGMSISKFIMELTMNPSPPWVEEHGTSHRVVLLLSGDPLESSKVVRDSPSTTKGPIDSKNDEDQLLEVGSWSDNNDRLPPKAGITDPKARKA